MSRTRALFVMTVLAVPLAAYGASSAVVWDRLTSVPDDCARILAPGGVFVARAISGDDLISYSPLDAIAALDGRPLFITHGTNDTRLSAAFGRRLEEAVRAERGIVQSWFVEGEEHTEAMLTDPAGYEERLVGFFGTTLATLAP